MLNQPTLQTTIDEFKLPASLRLLNGGAAVFRKFNVKFVDLSESKIAAAACRQTKLDDFGDPEFRESAKVVLDTVDCAGTLNFVGRVLYHNEFLRLYINRLYITNVIKKQPEIVESIIRRPFFVASFPRTGTTLLFNLLTQDRAARFPATWQLLYPILPNAPQNEIQRRIDKTQQFLDRSFQLIPEIQRMSSMDACGASECFFALPNNYGYTISSGSLAYREWFLQRDSVPDYTFYRQQLQVLQWQQPECHWVLKCPSHQWKLDALLKVFTDAAIIQTHRHPKEMLASWCSMVTVLSSLSTNTVDLHRIGSEWLEMMKIGLSRAMAARAAQPDRFYDVRYRELVKNPVGTLQQIYEHFDYPFTSETQASITNWLMNNPQHKHGTHRYALEQFGLTEKVVNRTFADYIDQFELDREI